MKIVRSFRLTPESVDLLQKAAEETGVAQGDILEGCILKCIEGVSKQLAAKVNQDREQRQTALARLNVGKRGPGRPRKDATRSEESPSEPVLKKRQQS
jgi:hypothetical protein